MVTTQGVYDEALDRFHATGPEFEGWLSNHGPMVVEALARRGSGELVHRWTDSYLDRLDDAPVARFRIGAQDWHHDFGNAVLLGEWREFFRAEVAEHGWQATVATWWPRLLPGIASGATHGVIRLGHALRAIRDEETEPRRTEVAHALGYWAARWEPVTIVWPSGRRPVGEVVEGLPGIPDQRFGIRYRLRQQADLPELATQLASAAGPAGPDEVTGALETLVGAAVAAYSRLAHGNPTMLVHAVTAPNAVRLALPSLPRALWLDAYAAAWTATAAVVSAYRPQSPRPVTSSSETPEQMWERVVENGGEHIVKLADTVLDACRADSSGQAVSAVDVAISLDA